MIPTRTRLVVAVLVFAGVVFGDYLDPGSDMMALAPPSRPSSFQNFQEMQRYLFELNRFYHAMSRPRYGRDVHQQHLKGKKMNTLLRQLLLP